MKIKNLGIAAVAAMFAAGSTGTAALAVSGDKSTDSSAATITLSGCIIDSSKEISNIEYFADGAPVTKDETFNTSSFDLTTVEGIQNIDTVAVKAGTTVETFTISCAPAPAPDDGTVPEDGGIEGDSAVITLSGCVLNSTKDISNIGYYSGGTLVAKDESINTRSYDLTTVTGIEDIDTVAVKSSTTIETFTISCAPATSPDGGTGGTGDGDAAGGNSGDSAMSS